MAKFKVYAKSTTFYVAEVEVENAEDIVFDDIDFDDYKEQPEIEWQVLDVIEEL
jgi:thymidylate synthase